MRYWRSEPAAFVKPFRQWSDEIALKRIADFNRMAPVLILRPSLSKQLGKLHHCRMPLGICRGAWPSPLNAQRGFAPALRCTAVPVHKLNTHSRARDGCQRLAAELKCNASGDR